MRKKVSNTAGTWEERGEYGANPVGSNTASGLSSPLPIRKAPGDAGGLEECRDVDLCRISSPVIGRRSQRLDADSRDEVSVNWDIPPEPSN